MSPARAVLDLARSRPPTLDGGRLVCIDGPAGSGKTTLAEELAASAPGSHVVHMDDLYDGWDGLPGVEEVLTGLLLPLAAGRPGAYPRYDWHQGRYVESVRVLPVPLLVLEGVGCAPAGLAHLVTVLVWVEAPADLRLRRGLERDGERLRPQWERWQVDEAAHFARERTRERADVVVDTGGPPST